MAEDRVIVVSLDLIEQFQSVSLDNGKFSLPADTDDDVAVRTIAKYTLAFVRDFVDSLHRQLADEYGKDWAKLEEVPES